MNASTTRPKNNSQENGSIATDSGLKREEYKKDHSVEGDTVNKPAKRKTVLSRLRRNFEHHVKSKDDSSKHGQKPKIRQFRRKFQNDGVVSRNKTYSGPFWKKKSQNEKLSRSKSYDGRKPQSLILRKHKDHGDVQLNGMQSVQSSGNFQYRNDSKPKDVPKLNKDVEYDRVHKAPKDRQSCLSLFHIIQHSQLIAVKLQRTTQEKWGIELIQADKEGFSMSYNDTEIKGARMTGDSAKKPVLIPIIVSQPEASASPSASHYGHLVAEFQEVFRRSAKRKHHGIKAAISSAPKEGNYQPRHGVRIAGLTEEGVAARDGKLAVEDLIVEVNGKIVLDSSPEEVVAAIEGSLTADLVVSRAMDPIETNTKL